MDQLIRDNEGLIYEAVFQYYPGLKITDDIMQLGRIGLWRAARTFDESKGSFAHYAVLNVRYMIGVHFRDSAFNKRAINDTAAHLEDPVPGFDDAVLGDTIPAQPYHSFVDWEGIKSALKERDLEILGYMMAGYNNREIGEKIGVGRERARQLTDRIKKIVKEYV